MKKLRVKDLVITIFLLSLTVIVWTVEPLQFWREPLTEDQLENALPEGYLPLFYEYVDELGFYFLERKNPISWKINEETICFFEYSPRFIFWKSSDIYVIREPRMSEQEMLFYYSCLAHEIGHAIDSISGRISETEEFQKAVELSIEMCEDDPREFYDGCFITEYLITEFPGVNGNPLSVLSKSEWGGYKELYAELFAYGLPLDMIPPPLRIFYQDYLP